MKRKLRSSLWIHQLQGILSTLIYLSFHSLSSPFPRKGEYCLLCASLSIQGQGVTIPQRSLAHCAEPNLRLLNLGSRSIRPPWQSHALHLTNFIKGIVRHRIKCDHHSDAHPHGFLMRAISQESTYGKPGQVSKVPTHGQSRSADLAQPQSRNSSENYVLKRHYMHSTQSSRSRRAVAGKSWQHACIPGYLHRTHGVGPRFACGHLDEAVAI